MCSIRRVAVILAVSMVVWIGPVGDARADETLSSKTPLDPIEIIRGTEPAEAILTRPLPRPEIAPVPGDGPAIMPARLDEVLGTSRQGVGRFGTGRLADLFRRAARGERGTPGVDYSRAWIDRRPETDGGAQWRCLTEALYFEARGESVKGMFAVAEVILNRVDSRRYPGTICEVVQQGTGKIHACQFSYTCDGLPERVREPGAWTRVGKVARLMMDGAPRSLTDGATHYHTKAVSPRWARVFYRVATIGTHHFYDETRG